LLRDVLDRGHAILKLPVLMTHSGDRQPCPARLPVLANVSFLDAVADSFALHQFLEKRRTQRHIFGMSYVDKRYLLDLFPAVAEQFLERRIHPEQPTRNIDQGHTDAGIVEDQPEFRFAPAQRLFGAFPVGDVHVDANHPDRLIGFVVKYAAAGHQPANLAIAAATNAEFIKRFTALERLLEVLHRETQIVRIDHRLPVIDLALERTGSQAVEFLKFRGPEG